MAGREKLPSLLRKLAYLLALVVMGWTLWRHRHQYDILHVYQLNLLALPTVLVSRIIGKPIIIAVRSAGSTRTIKSSNQGQAGGAGLAPALWVGGDLEALARMGKPLVRLTRYLLRHTHAVVVVLSSRMKDYLAAHDFNLHGMQLIPNGVDIARFQPLSIDTAIDEHAHVVICVSKMRFEKGIDVLLQAWHLVHEQVPQARLIIVGSGPIQTQLEDMAQALDISDCVEFTGLQSNIPAQLHR